ncbi:hypothetical protein PM082_023934 [Marasmius tenuissimus]|nr:hypothetical protein PM082_023934 [Marasmius tenuissimus]
MSEEDLPDVHKVRRWAKLRLPNGQNTRACWKEEPKGTEHVHMSCHVKHKDTLRVGEVHFYFVDKITGKEKHLAVVSLFGEPNKELYERSSKTYSTMEHHRDIDVHVVEVKSILSVVIMAPDPHYKCRIQDGSENNCWFMVEKPGLTILGLQGFNEAEDESLASQEGL